MVEQLLHNAKEKEAEISKRTQAFEKEVKIYQSLINSLSENELDQKAKKQLELGNLDKAEKLLEEANQKDENKIARRNKELAQLNELTLNYPKAILYYEKALKQKPSDLSAWKSLATLYQRLGNTQKTLKAWQQLQQHAKSQDASRWYNVALSGEADSLAKQGERALALDKYKQIHQYFLSQVYMSATQKHKKHIFLRSRIIQKTKQKTNMV